MSTLPHDLFDNAPERSPLALPPRHPLGDQYLVGRILGHPGGFGITYLGWQGVLERRVAIKEYLPRDLVSRGRDGISIVPHSPQEGQHFFFGLERFLDEARTLAGLSHPNVVRVHQFFEANGTAYLVMEYHRGASLAEYLERASGRLPWRHAAEVLLAVLAGLIATHENGILHCDIKPQNIYLTENQQVILLDYGAARLAVTERTQTSNRVMTPGYAAWEMYLERGELGPWTDVYSSAATLLQLLTGHRPPPAIDRLSRDALDLSQLKLPGDLANTLRRALALRPEKRTPSARAFAAELRELLETTDAENPSSSTLNSFSTSQKVLETFEDVTRSWRLVQAEHLPRQPLADAAETTPAPEQASNASAMPGVSGRRLSRSSWILVLILVVLALVSFIYLRPSDSDPALPANVERSQPDTPTPKPPPPQPSSATLATGTSTATLTGITVLDATPWGDVVSVRNDAGEEAEISLPCATPCRLELPAGVFVVTVEGRSANAGQTQNLEIEVKEGEALTRTVRFKAVDAKAYFLASGW